MPRRLPLSPLSEGSSRMVCSISAGMVGVCLTVIGLIRVSITMNKTQTIADDVLAFDAILFLTATLCAYFTQRGGNDVRMHRLERTADAFFLVAMVTLVVVCFLVTYMTL